MEGFRHRDGRKSATKRKTRRSLVEAAFSQLSAERSFASLSLREVARKRGSPRRPSIVIFAMSMSWV
jgi:AcrR family transcriptional regulator